MSSHPALSPELDRICQELLTEAGHTLSDESFIRALVVVTRALKIHIETMAKECGVHKAQIHKWMVGQHPPHDKNKAPVIEYLWRELDRDRLPD
jgi:hypothetical protein